MEMRREMVRMTLEQAQAQFWSELNLPGATHGGWACSQADRRRPIHTSVSLLRHEPRTRLQGPVWPPAGADL